MASPLSFKNDDYNYLINNNELIMTCREALAENEVSSIGIVNKSPEEVDLQFLSYTSQASTSSTCSSGISGGAGCSGNGISQLPVVVLNNTTKPITDKVSLKEFSRWLTRTEDHLISVCYCSFHSGNVNLNSFKPIKTKTVNKNTNTNNHSNWIDAIAEHKVIQAEIQSVGRRFINSLKANANKIDQSLLTAQEDRWHVLWLKSIEYSMLVEEFNICPNHTTWNRERSSTPHSNSKRFKLGPFSEGKENIKGMMRNRRIQTNMIGIGAGPGLNETFNLPNGKYEIIHKDIGYSSDADMSDACEPASCPNYINTNAKSPRKRHRRRRPRIGERPWSFHSEWTGWDYYQPPLGFSGEYRSSEDLNSFEDENLVRSLTEFGENYERWFKTDDGILRASEDLASHEEESLSRSLTDSLGTHSDRPWSKASHHGDGFGGSKNRSKLLGKKNKFFTSSPNITCSSITGTETADSLDFTTESIPTSGAKIQVASAVPPVAATTFTIKGARASTTHNDDDDTDADADVITDDLVPLAKAQTSETVSAEIDDNDDDNRIAMKITLKKSPTFILSSPINNNNNNYNSSSTQTQQLTSSKSTTTTSTPTKTSTSTSTKYFFIYLTITLLMAVILSILVATLSPISPHVQKTYPNRSPPN